MIEHSITLDIQWIPREMNARADYISQLIDTWQITNELFLYLERWGPHTVDCFTIIITN